MLPFSHFGAYWKALLDLPAQDRYCESDLRCEEFFLFSECGLDAYYIPFHHLNLKARIVIVGVTPCWTQMERAFSIAKEGIAAGLEQKALFAYIDRAGRFDGLMRWNLIEMLDRIGLPNYLGIDSCRALFRESPHLAHFTSTVSAPVFKDGQNYTGLCPKLLKVPQLRDLALKNLAYELRALPNAIIIPLGDVPGEAIQFLSDNKLILIDRCLFGFPHPSGANRHRRTRFDIGRKRWTEQLRASSQGVRADLRMRHAYR